MLRRYEYYTWSMLSRQLECCYSEVYLARVGRGVVFE